MGFKIVATRGTFRSLRKNGILARSIFKVGEGRPNIVDGIKNGEINLVINTPTGSKARFDEQSIGKACIQKKILIITTLSGASAVIRAIRLYDKKKQVKSIQEYHA